MGEHSTSHPDTNSSKGTLFLLLVYIWVSRVSILPISTIFLLDFGTVPTVCYCFVFHFIFIN
jgi:hypothetical protein